MILGVETLSVEILYAPLKITALIVSGRGGLDVILLECDAVERTGSGSTMDWSWTGRSDRGVEQGYLHILFPG
jgi:hypothetical protein